MKSRLGKLILEIFRNKNIFVSMGIIIFALIYGMCAERFYLWPYYQLRPIINTIEVFVQTLVSKTSSPASSASNVALGPEYRTQKSIETALLPLVSESYKLSVAANINLTAGGICRVKGSIIISDRLGVSYQFALGDNRVTPLPWPELPNNYAQFLKSAKADSKGHFRVHGILCVPVNENYEILLAHEFYDLADNNTHLAVSKLLVSQDLKPLQKDWTQIFTSPGLPGKFYAANGAGGRMAWLGGSKIVLTIGDYNLDGVFAPEIVAQDKEGVFGSVFKLDFEDRSISKMSYGHRNPQGVTVLNSGEIMEVEHGPKGGDELNRIQEGKNYGWPKVSYGTHYTTYSWPNSGLDATGRHEGFEKPIFSWVPSVATTNLIEITRFHPRWKGDLLIASLKAESLYRARYEDGVVRYVEPIWIGSRIRDLVETGDGRIAIWTDQGELIFLSVDQDVLQKDVRAEAAVTAPKSINCLTCHHLGPTNASHSAPSLSKILGRPVASDTFEGYSDVLKGVGGRWSEDRLRAFLLNPNDFAPGTRMIIPDLSLSQVDDAVKFLKRAD